jgi:ClpP class serine protease
MLTSSHIPFFRQGLIYFLATQAFRAQDSLPKKKIALVIESPGGSAKSAFQLAMLLKRHCGGFVAVVPRYAKSAATLLALGADEIIL